VGKIILYEHLGIDPQKHNVADPEQATRKYLAVGIKNLIVIVDNPSKKGHKLSFEAEFVLVKRQELWFLANGFLWPLYM